jgi:hypothetical protein
MALVTADVTWL